MGFISRYVREQKRYTKNEIKSIFSFSESEAESFIRRLKSFGIMKAVKNTAGQRDLSDLSDADIEIADDTGESSECFYVFTYVGVLTIGDRVVKCFPKYITQNDAPDTEMKQVIRVLRRYGSKEQIVNLYNGDGQSSSFNILAVMLFLLEDYHQYGAYINSEDIVEVNGEGPILWGQTIDNGFALISSNRPYYVDIYTHRSVDDEQDFFHRLHRCIVSESSRQLRDAGLIDLFDLVEADVSDEALEDFGDREYILYRLQSELGVQFNTHKQTILKTLYAFISYHRTLIESEGISMYGTNSFNLVWENVCAEVFNNKLKTQLRHLPFPDGLTPGYDPKTLLIDCSSRFAVVDSDNSCRVVNHPLVPPLETIPAVAWADEPHQIGLFHDPPIPLLPVLAPANLKAPIRAGTDEPNSCSIGSKIQHDFCYPEIDPSRRSRYECSKSGNRQS